MDYIEQLEIQVKNNQQAVYDVSGLLNEYVEMKRDVPKLQKHMKKRFDRVQRFQLIGSHFLTTVKTATYN